MRAIRFVYHCLTITLLIGCHNVKNRLLIAGAGIHHDFWLLTNQFTPTIFPDIEIHKYFNMNSLVVSIKTNPGNICALVLASSLCTNMYTALLEIKAITLAPIILITCTSSLPDEGMVRQAGIFYYFLMPDENPRMLEIVRYAINRPANRKDIDWSL